MTAISGLMTIAGIVMLALYIQVRECLALDLDSVDASPLIPDALPSDDIGHRRRRAAKLGNERLKTMATFLNGLGIAVFVAVAVTLPGAKATSLANAGLGLSGAIGLHILAHVVLSWWKSEE